MSRLSVSSLIPHPSYWPDSGLTRNTRAPGYRCSVPGLAGFTGTTLCGARSLITCQKLFDKLRLVVSVKPPQNKVYWTSNLRLAVRQHAQQSINREMQNDVGDYRNNNRQQQSVSLIGAGTCDNPSKRSVKGIGDRHDELNKPGRAARSQQR